MKHCILCLNVSFSKNALPIEEKQECGSTIEEIIKLHFWFHDASLKGIFINWEI